MVTKTSALVDAVYDWSRPNTLPRAYGWIEKALKKDPSLIDPLIVDTLQYSNKGTVKRIGYLLAQLGIHEDRTVLFPIGNILAPERLHPTIIPHR